jgi:hypothetical protein
MDFYNSPGIYILDRYKWFDLPREDGSFVKVIAVSSNESIYWIIAYAIMVALIFAAVSRLAVDLVLTFLPLKGSGNRVVMLVAFYNANNPTTAILLMIEYCRRALFNATIGNQHAVDWSTLRCALSLMATAMALIAATTTAQFLVSGQQLIERRATRVYPFYPNFIDAQTDEYLLDTLKPIRASAGFLALGRFETSWKHLVDRVHINTEELPRDAGRRMLRFKYEWEITGYEMGLQNAANLKLGVSGSCQTDYSGYNESGIRDYWLIWPNYQDANYPNGYRDAYNPLDEQLMPPFIGDNILPGQTMASIIKDGFIFSLLPHTEFRLTSAENLDDPWYSTGRNPDYNASDLQRYAYGGKLRVKRGRPTLMCVQRDNYTLDGTDQLVHHVDELKQLRGLKLSRLLRDNVFRQEFGIPVIAFLARSLGTSSLASSIYWDPTSRMFTADKASLREDFTKLVFVAFLYSREVARNTVLLYPTLEGKGVENVANVNGSVPYEYSDIILDSSEVAALSVKVLIITPTVCVFVWIPVLIRRFLIRPKAIPMSENSGSARLNLHTIGLQATQLYRCLDEEVSGQRKWSGRLSMTPYIKEVEEDRWNGQNQPEKDAFVLPKLVQLEADVANNTSDDAKEKPDGSEASPAEKRYLLRVDSDGRALSGAQYDLVLTNRRPQSSQQDVSSMVHWGDVQNNRST